MYYIYGVSVPSLLIQSTDSMIIWNTELVLRKVGAKFQLLIDDSFDYI